MLIRVRHHTRYRYGYLVDHALQRLRLTPVATPAQDILDWSITSPGIETGVQYQDAYGNTTHLAVSPEPVAEIEVVATGLVETRDTHGVVGYDKLATPASVFLRETPATAPDRALQWFADQIPAGKPLERLHALMAQIHQRIEFDTDATHTGTNAHEAFAQRRGVCQDHAHVFICVARLLGIPGRYVTGYLYMPDEAPAVAHHAWAEAYVDDLGWTGFDAANGISPNDHYIRLACGFDAHGTAPVTGTRRGGGDETLEVEVQLHQAEGAANPS